MINHNWGEWIERGDKRFPANITDLPAMIDPANDVMRVQPFVPDPYGGYWGHVQRFCVRADHPLYNLR